MSPRQVREEVNWEVLGGEKRVEACKGEWWRLGFLSGGRGWWAVGGARCILVKEGESGFRKAACMDLYIAHLSIQTRLCYLDNF